MPDRADPQAESPEPPSPASAGAVRAQLSATERLVEVAEQLSTSRDLAEVMAVVRHAARSLTGADGATFILRDGDLCFYADEDAITPLWKGRRFPISSCISGWAMLHRASAVVEDIYADPRIPHDAYRPTFVKSLAVVPIRTSAPVGAIGNYWAQRHRASDGEVKLLRALADLTSVAMENVHLYGELQKRIQEADDAVRARDEFISVAAHELRTPLTALMLQLQRLEVPGGREAVRDVAEVSERASRAIAGARRLAALIEGMLDASHLPHTRIELAFEQFDLVAAVRAVLDRFGAHASAAGCELRLDAPSPVLGRWDRGRIQQVMTNLLSNAVKYGAGSPIEVRVERHGDRARVRVRDHGPGIAPEVAHRIFERFGRAGPTEHYGGLGLGLYLARAAIEAHGGTIHFDSEPNEGCTFTVELPAAG